MLCRMQAAVVEDSGAEEIDRIHEYNLLVDHSVFMEAINKCLVLSVSCSIEIHNPLSCSSYLMSLLSSM